MEKKSIENEEVKEETPKRPRRTQAQMNSDLRLAEMARKRNEEKRNANKIKKEAELEQIIEKTIKKQKTDEPPLPPPPPQPQKKQPPDHSVKKKQQKQHIKEESDDEESEEDLPPPKKKPAKKPPVKYDSSSDEEEPPPKPKLKRTKAVFDHSVKSDKSDSDDEPRFNFA